MKVRGTINVKMFNFRAICFQKIYSATPNIRLYNSIECLRTLYLFDLDVESDVAYLEEWEGPVPVRSCCDLAGGEGGTCTC